MYEGHLKSSLVGDSEDQDDVTIGRNLVLHLNKGDQVNNLYYEFKKRRSLKQLFVRLMLVWIK